MKLKFIAAAALAALLGSSAASAGEDVGWYILGAAGVSNADSTMHDSMVDNMRDIQTDADVSTYGKTETDKTNVAIKLIEGYRFNDYFAVEGGYYYLGRTKSDTTVTDLDSGNQYKAHAKLTGHMLAIDAVGILLINERFELFAKAGAGVVRAKATFSDNDDSSWSETKTRLAPKLGVGTEWYFVENWALRAEYERVWNAYKCDGEKAHYNIFTVGVKYLF